MSTAPDTWYVEDVHDGDTLSLCRERVTRAATAVTVRLAYIDAPELAQAPWGVKARAYLRFMLLYREPVLVQPVTLDQYGRTVAEVLRARDYGNLGLRQLLNGHAAAYYCPPEQTAHWAAQGIAKRKRLGIWRAPGLHQTPWVFRQQR